MSSQSREKERAAWYVIVFHFQSALLLASGAVSSPFIVRRFMSSREEMVLLGIVFGIMCAYLAVVYFKTTLALIQGRVVNIRRFDNRRDRSAACAKAGILMATAVLLVVGAFSEGPRLGIGPLGHLAIVGAAGYMFVMGLCMVLWARNGRSGPSKGTEPDETDCQ